MKSAPHALPRPTQRRPLLRAVLAAVAGFALLPAARVDAHPRMISYGHTSCIACHVSVQGRGLLKGYGRGIDMEQSLSDLDFTAQALGKIIDAKYATGDWDGQFGHVLSDLVLTGRINQEFDRDKTDPTFSALFRQVIFVGAKQHFRVNYEVGLRDTELHDTKLGPHLTATGGRNVFLKKLMLEWRIKGKGASGGSELAIGRDYLPIGLQLDDYSTYSLHLNRDGIYDFPLQLKYFVWKENWLASAFVFAPTFEEAETRREYGAGFLFERYPITRLVLGAQALMGFADESNRLRIGPYVRWGISPKWTLLAEVDYTHFWDAGIGKLQGDQVTAFLQLYYHHTEWLVSSLTGNYANSQLLTSGEDHFSGRYTLSARLNRNLTIGVTYTRGDIRRNLSSGEEGSVFANLKF